MARFYGVVGYAFSSETDQDVHTNQIIERAYFGDVKRNIGRVEQGQWLHEDIDVQNTISIVADAFAYENFHAIRYVEWMGVKWTVKSVEVARPRLELSIGGVYNDH